MAITNNNCYRCGNQTHRTNLCDPCMLAVCGTTYEGIEALTEEEQAVRLLTPAEIKEMGEMSDWLAQAANTLDEMEAEEWPTLMGRLNGN